MKVRLTKNFRNKYLDYSFYNLDSDLFVLVFFFSFLQRFRGRKKSDARAKKRLAIEAEAVPRKLTKVTSDGGELLDKMAAWSDMNLPTEILRALSDLGYTSPTDIQKAVIPKALENFDIIGAAETGSGKTLAFVIPMLVGIVQNCE